MPEKSLKCHSLCLLNWDKHCPGNKWENKEGDTGSISKAKNLPVRRICWLTSAIVAVQFYTVSWTTQSGTRFNSSRNTFLFVQCIYHSVNTAGFCLCPGIAMFLFSGNHILLFSDSHRIGGKEEGPTWHNNKFTILVWIKYFPQIFLIRTIVLIFMKKRFLCFTFLWHTHFFSY